MTEAETQKVELEAFDAFIFDMDGVVTDSARTHAMAWKQMFDEFLSSQGKKDGKQYKPFDAHDDYLRYVDGKQRYDGAKSFLESRQISLPFGNSEDPPDSETVCGLANRKNGYFLRKLKTDGVESYQSTVELIRELKMRNVRVAVISASRNAKAVLDASGVRGLFDAEVDGVDVEKQQLKGKPHPDIFIEAARRLKVDPGRAAVVEDALAGVEAGKAGGFALVIGVDREGQEEQLKKHGADVVVTDLAKIKLDGMIETAPSEIDELPSALAERDEIMERLDFGTPAIFLDYDGTLTPIVSTPDKATLPKETREILRKLADRWMVAVVSGRDLADVRGMVGLDNIIYAGSHGFDVEGPGEEYTDLGNGDKFLPALDSAEPELAAAVKDFKGAWVERKRFAIALHYRQADPEIVPDLEKIVNLQVEKHPELRKSRGKKVFELRPDADWDKGKAILSMIDTAHVDSSRVVPLYIGDDTTDEDAFRAVRNRGVAIVVGSGDRGTMAGYRLGDPSEVAQFLETLVEKSDGEVAEGSWVLTYDEFEPPSEQLREALCTVGNGYFATRGAAPESSAGATHYPGTYLAGCYNRLVSEVAGETIENESLVNAPNWLSLNFKIEDGEWFAPEDAEFSEYRQDLDMRQGLLIRQMQFEDSRGRRTRVMERRFAHMGLPHLAGLQTTIEPENWSGKLIVRSAIDGRVENSLVQRYRQLNNKHLDQVAAGRSAEDIIWLETETTDSKIGIAEAVRTRVFRDRQEIQTERRNIEKPGYIAQEVTLDVERKQAITISKVAAIYTSRDRAISNCRLEAQKAAARAPKFPWLLTSHVLGWDHLWERCRISTSTETPRLQQILNLHIFHLLQSVSVNSIDLDAGVPPRGLHGEAYRGLIMWDELFIFPLISLRIPDLTRSLLQYRFRRLPEARWAARREGYRGAMFPWQSGSNGREEAQTLHLNPRSGRWIPDNSHLQKHINAAVAYNIWHYYQVTGDVDFIQYYGAEMLFELARFWASMAQYNQSLDRYEILKVMGPDEFHDRYPGAEEPGLDNNAYTNVMAAWVLCRALEAADLLPRERRRAIMEDMGLTRDELERWDEISRRMRVVFHGDEIISQFEGYDDLKEFDWEGYRKKYHDIHRLDRILEAEGDSPNDYKVSKQADVLMLFYLFSAEELEEMFDRLGYRLDPDAIPRNVDYYMKRTSHGSTLSAIVHSWVLSRTMREESWNLFRSALESDVSDVQGGTTHEGIHLGAMAGTVDLIQRCYAGLEARRDMLRFNPYLPKELKRVEFNIQYRSNWIKVEMTQHHLRVSSRLEDVFPINVAVNDEITELSPGETLDYTLAD
jgi:alpha,alpha-trehalase